MEVGEFFTTLLFRHNAYSCINARCASFLSCVSETARKRQKGTRICVSILSDGRGNTVIFFTINFH